MAPYEAILFQQKNELKPLVTGKFLSGPLLPTFGTLQLDHRTTSWRSLPQNEFEPCLNFGETTTELNFVFEMRSPKYNLLRLFHFKSSQGWQVCSKVELKSPAAVKALIYKSPNNGASLGKARQLLSRRKAQRRQSRLRREPIGGSGFNWSC